jgi:hypothetical protein
MNRLRRSLRRTSNLRILAHMTDNLAARIGEKIVDTLAHRLADKIAERIVHHQKWAAMTEEELARRFCLVRSLDLGHPNIRHHPRGLPSLDRERREPHRACGSRRPRRAGRRRKRAELARRPTAAARGLPEADTSEAAHGANRAGDHASPTGFATIAIDVTEKTIRSDCNSRMLTEPWEGVRPGAALLRSPILETI